MKPKLRNSLQRRIFIFTLLIVFIPLVLLGVFSYWKSTELITEKLKNTDEDMIEQIGANIEFILEDFHDLSLFFIQSEQGQDLLNPNRPRGSQEFYEEKRNVEQLLLHLIGSKDYISSIQVENNNSVLVNTHSNGDSLEKNMKKKLNKLNGGALLTANPESSVISYSRLVKNVNNVTEPLGFMTINMQLDYLSRLFRSKITGELDSYFLVDDQNEIIIDEDTIQFSKDNLAKVLEQDIQNGNKSGTIDITIDNHDYIKTYYQMEGTPLSIIHIVSLDELKRENQVIPTLILVALIVSLLICTLAAYQFSKFIVRPINQLQLLMKKVEYGDFDVRFTPKGNNEIDLLGNGFNSMLEKIKFLIEMVYLAQIRNKEAELKALYAQINPHFLYNTLDTIYWMGQMEDAPKSARMTHALSKLFRIMLKDQKDVTTIENEIDYVKHYLEIQKIRYDDVIIFDIDVQPETFQVTTIKMVLQPLIENAISHGIEPKEEGGTVNIQVRKLEQDLEIIVEDDGIGADVSALKQMLHEESDDHRGIALKNIHDRIQIRSGKGYGLSFHQNEKGGLTVTVREKWEV